MKLFEKGAKVFFLKDDEIIEGIIDRNNWVNTGTYNVLFEIDWDQYKDIFKDTSLYKSVESIKNYLKEIEKQRIEAQEKQKQYEIDNAEYNKNQSLENIQYYQKNIESYERGIEQYKKDIRKEELKIENYNRLLTLKLTDGNQD